MMLFTLQPDVWAKILSPEIDTAKAQTAEDVIQKGIVLAIKSDGKIVRRGIGIPVWKQVEKELGVADEKKTK